MKLARWRRNAAVQDVEQLEGFDKHGNTLAMLHPKCGTRTQAHSCFLTLTLTPRQRVAHASTLEPCA